MSERELLVQIATEMVEVRRDITDIKVTQRATNGQVAELKIEHYRQAGAITMLRFIGGLTLAGIGAGAAIAGVILTIVARGV